MEAIRGIYHTGLFGGRAFFFSFHVGGVFIICFRSNKLRGEVRFLSTCRVLLLSVLSWSEHPTKSRANVLAGPQKKQTGRREEKKGREKIYFFPPFWSERNGQKRERERVRN